MTLYQGRYRIETARLKDWDYGTPGAYFVTICTRDRTHFFGEVVGGEMRLTAIGQAADVCWRDIPDHFPHVSLDVFVVMPNHVHGIIIIGPHDVSTNVETRPVETRPVETDAVETRAVETRAVETDAVETHAVETRAVETRHVASLPDGGDRFGPLRPGALPTIVHAYKAAVTRWCRANCHADFAWQARYYDHIVRNEAEMNRICQYIVDNPARWGMEAGHPESLWM